MRRRLAPTDDAHVVRLLDGGLDWPYLFNQGDRHHLLPLLNECLAARDGAVPLQALRALAWNVKAVRARNRHFAQELVRLHHAARAAGIRMLAFKGPVLAAAIYGDLGLRQFGDLDVLVDRASSSAAEEFFATLAYRPTREFGFEVTLVNASTRVALDLHRTLSADNFPVSLSFDALWERRAMVELDGACVDAFSTPDALIAVCIEAARDWRQGKVKLGKLSDVAHVLRATSRTEWTQVETEARRLGIQRVLGFGIHLAARVLELPVSRHPGVIAPPPRLTSFIREAEAALFGATTRPPPTRLHGDLLHFHLRERWRDRLRPYALSFHRLVTPNVHDRSVIALPRPLSPLYYLVRPLRLAHRYAVKRGTPLASPSPTDPATRRHPD